MSLERSEVGALQQLENNEHPRPGVGVEGRNALAILAANSAPVVRGWIYLARRINHKTNQCGVLGS